jgi:dipeptide/tripeptide permease
VTTAFAVGAAVGSVTIEMVKSASTQVWGYYAVFILSSIGRLAAALLFASQGRRFDRQAIATDDATNDQIAPTTARR